MRAEVSFQVAPDSLNRGVLVSTAQLEMPGAEIQHVPKQLLEGKPLDPMRLTAGEDLRIMPARWRHYRGDNAKFDCHSLMPGYEVSSGRLEYSFSKKLPGTTATRHRSVS